MDGLHILADLSGCQCDTRLLTDAAQLQTLCEQAVSTAKLHSLGALFHTYSNQDNTEGAQLSGATGILLLAESHLAVHTWPELKAVTLDIYACNYGQDNSAKVEHLFNLLAEVFKPADRSLQRGVTRVQRGVARVFA
jgi:S-adenosylmethionine/arginine decarboxylase-like enzyme